MGMNDGHRILAIKTMAVAAAVLSMAMMLLLSAPTIVQFASTEIPKMYGSLVSWLTPPYLYVVINGIIISIAASSRFHVGSDDEDVIGSGFESSMPDKKNQEVEVAATMEPAVEIDYDVPAEEINDDVEEEEEEEFVISRSSWDPLKCGTSETVTETENVMEYSLLTEKPLVSARLGRRKSLKASPEAGRALGVARPKRNDTLESTWKAITDGRAVPLTRRLKKSDTWEDTGTRGSREDLPVTTMRKWETFKERGGVRRSPVRKEASLGQDDLNRRVEAFIKKFNDEMRMQREESLNNYFQLMNR